MHESSSRNKRSVREKCREWTHCGGDRRVIWPRWTEWWYVNKRVTDTKEMAKEGGEREKSQLCGVWHLCRKHLAGLSITTAQLIDFLLFSIRFLRGSCFFSFLCPPDSFSSPSLCLSDSWADPKYHLFLWQVSIRGINWMSEGGKNNMISIKNVRHILGIWMWH